jgi:O-antigen/teichoic acid export membrane protein
MALAGRDALTMALHSGTVGVRALAWRYARYPLLGLPSSITNAVAQTLPVPLIAQAYGLPEAGFYALVQRVVGLPLTVIGASVADALLGRVAHHARTDPALALPLFRRTGATLFLLGLPIALALLLFGPPAFKLVFGAEWERAGDMASAVAPWYLAALAVSPLSRVVLVYQGQGSKLVYDVLSLAAVVGAIYVGPAAGLDVIAALWLLTAGQVIAYAVYWLVLDRMVRRGSASATGTAPARSVD